MCAAANILKNQFPDIKGIQSDYHTLQKTPLTSYTIIAAIGVYPE